MPTKDIRIHLSQNQRFLLYWTFELTLNPKMFERCKNGKRQFDRKSIYNEDKGQHGQMQYYNIHR